MNQEKTLKVEMTKTEIEFIKTHSLQDSVRWIIKAYDEEKLRGETLDYDAFMSLSNSSSAMHEKYKKLLSEIEDSESK